LVWFRLADAAAGQERLALLSLRRLRHRARSGAALTRQPYEVIEMFRFSPKVPSLFGQQGRVAGF
jgi:hypothetical protein